MDPASSTPRGNSCGLAGEGKKKQRIATAKLIVEYNATDKDIGVHGAFDDHGWSGSASTTRAGGDPQSRVRKSQLRDLTMAGIFFESREPPHRGVHLRGAEEQVPRGPLQVVDSPSTASGSSGRRSSRMTSPAAPRWRRRPDGAQVDPKDLTVSWKDVTQTVDGKPVKISGYEVIVTKEQEDDPHGFSRPIYDVHVPPDRNSLSVPAEFLEPGTRVRARGAGVGEERQPDDQRQLLHDAILRGRWEGTGWPPLPPQLTGNG